MLEGLGQIFGSDIYKIDVGMPKDPVIMFRGTFGAGADPSKDFVAAVAAGAGRLAHGVLPEGPRPAEACARWPTTIRPRCRWASRSNRTWVIVWCVAGVGPWWPA